ncbi:MAG: hypothetical protein F6K47_31830 [Symploca sp. SIO2E6]|nr:hypothetical protein [Symploca sp. SIO2E6]
MTAFLGLQKEDKGDKEDKGEQKTLPNNKQQTTNNLILGNKKNCNP